MSEVLTSKSFVFNTTIGNMLVTVATIRGFDVEDIIRARAVSQARAVQFLNIGKDIDINQPTAPRTISSTFLHNTQELT